jgi:hypothetical protein
MPTRVILGWIALLALACGQPARQARGSDASEAGQRSMKGWELYSWVDEADGEWRFSLLVGTNAIRPADAVTAPEQALDIASLERALAALAPGEEIVWPGPTARHGESGRLAMPDTGTRTRVERAARERALVLEVVDAQPSEAQAP